MNLPAINFDFVYAGMHAGDLAMWIAIATLTGSLARRFIAGPELLGLWTDMAIGLIGAFTVGWGLRQINVDLSQLVLRAQPTAPSTVAIWVDVLIASFVGAAAIRFLLKPFKR